jgi:hydroxyacid-oxoacid transhydrogenase
VTSRSGCDSAFEFTAARVRFGAGVTREIGMELADLRAEAVLVLADPNLARLTPVTTVLESLEQSRVPFVLYDQVCIEPTEQSWRHAIQFAARHTFDAIVAVGGGSTIDTAKAVNVFTTYPPADFYDYVNAPVGKGAPIPGALKPLFAVPTTAGTGSETTGVCIFDDTSRRVKTGISSRWL